MEQQEELAVDYEQKLRSEVMKGCQQVREFEQKLQGAMESTSTLIGDAAAIISTFVSVIAQLNRGDQRGATRFPRQSAAKPNTAPNSPTMPSSSSPMTCSPVRITPPHSPSLALSSPRTTSSSSPVLTPSTTPEGSPGGASATTAFSLEADDPNAAGRTSSATTDMAVDDFMTSGDLRSALSRKRKCLPKKVVKMPANSNEHGGEAPADDGFTWRKYGQKDILNSKHPRSYYRCTHQKELGCVATKYVQKCEDEPSLYQITYIGEHTCQIQQQQHAISWAPSRFHTTRPILENPFQMNPSTSSLTLNSSGGIQLTSSLCLSSRFEDMKAARLSLSPTRPSFNLLKPNASLASPSQWATPRFGMVSCPIKAEPLAAPAQLASQGIFANETDRSLLTMSLASTSRHNSDLSAIKPKQEPQQDEAVGAQSKGGAAAAFLQDVDQELERSHDEQLQSYDWENLEDFTKVVQVDTSDIATSASLEHIPRTSLAEDIGSYIHQIYMECEEPNAAFSEPMLFESDH